MTDIIVAGHVCLDVIPKFDNLDGSFEQVFTPGRLIDVSDALTALGGPVSNTGMALHKLGISTGLMGKVGSDMFGERILELMRSYSDDLADSMIIAEDVGTSYSIVINPPGVDRIFLHSPGANHTFLAADVDLTNQMDAKLFHFGYPPLMRSMYTNDGAELVGVMQRAKALGFTTTLDMAYPDPDSEAGQVDWQAILENALPYVDVFLPSFDETIFMLNPTLHDHLKQKGGNMVTHSDVVTLQATTDTLIDMGAKVVGLKLGDEGLYLRTAADSEAISAMGRAAPDPSNWANRELLAPIFVTDVVGTTGSGDATIAGFLAAMVSNMTIEQAALSAVAVGAHNVEAADSLSGIRPWEAVQQRLAGGWAQATPQIELTRWQQRGGIWISPNDATAS